MKEKVIFTEENIQKLFGNEAAENEDPKRLLEYYLKIDVYKQVAANVPVRILVGHKGIGKSALFKVSIEEDKNNGIMSILVQPNDVMNLSFNEGGFLKTIHNWTEGLSVIIIQKVLNSLGIQNTSSIEIDKESCLNRENGIIHTLKNVLEKYIANKDSVISEDKIKKYLLNPSVNVYIDDIDRGWEGKEKGISLISALFNAVRDISTDNVEINFKIAIRSDVYYLVRTSDESTDKIEGSVIWHSWTNHEIFILLVKRIETFFGRKIDEDNLYRMKQEYLAEYLSPIMESRFKGEGHWTNIPTYRILMSLIRKRPRDLIKLCTLAARHAYIKKDSKIGTENFKAIFEEYSQGRIQDLINEFRSELPDIEKIVMNMKPNRKEREARLGYVYKTADLLHKIDNLSRMYNFVFSSGRQANAQDLAAFLYKISFLTARKEVHDGITRKYFEENRYLSSKFADFGFDWEIHPAYRWALQPDNISEIFHQLMI